MYKCNIVTILGKNISSLTVYTYMCSHLASHNCILCSRIQRLCLFVVSKQLHSWYSLVSTCQLEFGILNCNNRFKRNWIQIFGIFALAASTCTITHDLKTQVWHPFRSRVYIPPIKAEGLQSNWVPYPSYWLHVIAHMLAGAMLHFGSTMNNQYIYTQTSSQFWRCGITLKAFGNFPDRYLLRIIATLEQQHMTLAGNTHSTDYTVLYKAQQYKGYNILCDWW